MSKPKTPLTLVVHNPQGGWDITKSNDPMYHLHEEKEIKAIDIAREISEKDNTELIIYDKYCNIERIKNRKSLYFGFITRFVEFVFSILQYFPFQFLLHLDPMTEDEFNKKSIPEQVEITKAKTIIVEYYVMSYFFIELLFIAFVPVINKSFFNWIAMIIAFLRIVDILQSNINIGILYANRYNCIPKVASVVRTLILCFINYIELIFCYSIIYITNIHNLEHATHWYDSVYFSVITQLTVGFGDIHPIGVFKLVAVSQGFVGLFFTLFILGKFITSLPSIKPLVNSDLED